MLCTTSTRLNDFISGSLYLRLPSRILPAPQPPSLAATSLFSVSICSGWFVYFYIPHIYEIIVLSFSVWVFPLTWSTPVIIWVNVIQLYSYRSVLKHIRWFPTRYPLIKSVEMLNYEFESLELQRSLKNMCFAPNSFSLYPRDIKYFQAVSYEFSISTVQ